MIFLFTLFYGIILFLKQRSFNLLYIRKSKSKSSATKNLILEPFSPRYFYAQFNQLVMKNQPEYKSKSQLLLRDHLRLYTFSISSLVFLLSLVNIGRYRQLSWMNGVSIFLFCLLGYFVVRRIKKIYDETSQKLLIEAMEIAIFLESLEAHGVNFNSRGKSEKEKHLLEFLELCASLQPLHHRQIRKTWSNILHGLVDASLGTLLVVLPPAGSPLMLKYIGYMVILVSVLYIGIIGAKYLQNREIMRLSHTILEPFLILP